MKAGYSNELMAFAFAIELNQQVVKELCIVFWLAGYEPGSHQD